MTVDVRDELIERMARDSWEFDGSPQPWFEYAHTYKEGAKRTLSVVETATSICPNPDCVDGWVAFGDGEPWTEEGKDRCPSCGGQPGPLLVLQVLGGTIDHDLSLSCTDTVWLLPR